MITLRQASELCLKSELNADELSQLMDMSTHILVWETNEAGQLPVKLQKLYDDICKTIDRHCPVDL
jgi:hypothetical protein